MLQPKTPIKPPAIHDSETSSESSQTISSPNQTWDLNKIESTTRFISSAQKAYFKKIWSAPEFSISAGTAMYYWVADMLTMVKIVEPDQQNLVMEEFCNDFLDFGLNLEKAIVNNQAQLPVYKLGFGDRMTAALTGRKAAMSLHNGEEINDWKASQFLETVNYNLTTLFVRNYLALKKKEENAG